MQERTPTESALVLVWVRTHAASEVSQSTVCVAFDRQAAQLTYTHMQ